MTAVLKLARKKQDAPDGTRRCLVTGEMKLRAEMIRFVIAPDQSVVPDLSENLPGHGLWVTATPDAISLAAKKNLFAKAAKCPARPAAALAADAARLARKRCLDFLGLAKGAGIAVLGESQTEAALRAGKLALYLHAPDATHALDNRSDVPECVLFSRDELGAALGYEHIVYAGLMPHGLTEKLNREIKRLGSMVA
ncbi:MAG: DUF448 domain-containing protein [Alphaproteobacteria bacterium]|nr:DUF448 domain-containing protein [Alphaproteobacteria bacterium]